MHIYVGTFLIAAATLALEVALTRLLSVLTWYHLAFFAVATAMLGMTAGAITVYLRPQWFEEERLDRHIAKACLGYALVTPFALVLLCLVPLQLRIEAMSLFALLVGTFACALPFYMSGIAITAVLTRKPGMPIGQLYASDLLGASFGCLLVLAGLDWLDAPSLILFCASIGCLAAFSFALTGGSLGLRRGGIWGFIALALVSFLNARTPLGIRPYVVKGRIEHARDYLLENWNSFSRVVVYPLNQEPPQLWGASPKAPKEKVLQYTMNIDGDAGTSMRRFASLADIEHLRYDVTNIVYHLRPRGGACVIGVGGGRDVQSALLFGQERVTGIEVNPIFVDLLRGRFKEFAGIAGRPEVTLIAEEARSLLSRSRDEFAVIQMSLIDTWAATGAGAFSLSENALYTTEAWKIFMDRLRGDGIFTVSRWYDPTNFGEAGRILSLAVATLLDSGVETPARHIAMVTLDKISTLLVTKEPFAPADLETLRSVTSRLGFELVIAPGVAPPDELSRAIVSSRSRSELSRAIVDAPLNYSPPTDDDPYFFNMLRLDNTDPIFMTSHLEGGVIRGNITATLTLLGLVLALLVVSLATIVLPLVLRGRRRPSPENPSAIDWSSAVYFSLIGSGFMFAEIGLIQRLSVFLGHPVYALGILLFTLVASAGLGSYLSERLPLTRKPWVFVYPPFIAAIILMERFGLPSLASSLVAASMAARILVSILVVSPLGFCLGICFPVGMRLARAKGDQDTPWYWALNGVFGVLSSAFAVFVSIYFGIAVTFYIAACCYLLLLGCVGKMSGLSEEVSAS